MSQPQHELERQELLRECHSLIALIGQHTYSTKLLRAARDGLRLVSGYNNESKVIAGSLMDMRQKGFFCILV